MRISWKFLCLALLAAGPLVLSGCGGLAATQSISPLDFLLPGLIKADPPQTNAPVATVQYPVEVVCVR